MADEPATVEAMPEWNEANARYIGAKAEAAAAKDELAASRAEIEWLQQQSALKDQFQLRQSAIQLRNTTMAQIKQEYPSVPEAVYRNIQDPQEMLVAAKDVHEQIAKAAPAPTGWGTPPAGTPDARSTSFNNRLDDPNYLQDLRRRAKAGNREAVSEVKKAAFGIALSKTEKYSKARRGER